MYSYSQIIGWFLHGILQRILVWIPVLKPIKEDPAHPPSWWYDCYSWMDWWSGIGADGYPNEYWCGRYIRCALVHFANKIVGAAGEFTKATKDFLLGRIGFVQWGFGSMGAWVNSLSNKIGRALPWWATDAIDGLRKLWDLLPEPIRNAWASWEQVWDDIKRAVYAWAKARYDDAKRFSLEAKTWLLGIGQNIENWWRECANWLGDLKRDPYGTITQTLGVAWTFLQDFHRSTRERIKEWLGPSWPLLEEFSTRSLRFWDNLWADSWADISDLFADPLGFIGDRLEQIVEDRW